MNTTNGIYLGKVTRMMKLKLFFKNFFGFFAVILFFKKFEITIKHDPYVIKYKNKDDVPRKAVLFGYNDYYASANFGNDAGIEIENLQGGTYGRVIAQSGLKPFKIGCLRIQSIDLYSKYKDKKLTIITADANGKMYTTPILFGTMIDPYQMQIDIVQKEMNFNMDGNTSITFDVEPNTELVMSIYPKETLKVGYREYKRYKQYGSNSIVSYR